MSDNNTPTNSTDVLAELRAIRELLAATRADPSGGLLDKEQAAALARIGASTLDWLRAAGAFGPADIRVGGAVRWRRAEVVAWLAHPLPSGELMDRTAWPPFWAELQRRHRM